MRLLLALAVLTAIAGAASSPLEERTTPAPTPPPVVPAPGMSAVAPFMGGPGSVADPEGAAGHAIELLAQFLGIRATELRLVGVEARTWPDACRGRAIPGRYCAPSEISGWSVTLRDAFDGQHTANVTVDGTSWLPQMEETGTILSRDVTTQLLTIEVGGAPLVVRIWNTATGLAIVPPVGARVAFGYDPSPRGDGTAVLTWIVSVP
jgi:hypothetical protein